NATVESRKASLIRAPAGSPPRSHYIRLLPPKFRRNFVILGGLRVYDVRPFGALPNRRLLGPGDEEGQGRLLGGGARGGEPDAAVPRLGFRAAVACASRRSTARSRSRRTTVCSRICRPSRRKLSGTSRCAWHEPCARDRSGSIPADRPHAI